MATQRTEREQAFRAILRLCDAGLSSVSLRQRVGERIQALIPCDDVTFAAVDPDSGLLGRSLGPGAPAWDRAAGGPERHRRALALQVLEMTRTGALVEATPDDVVRDLLRPEGPGHDLRAVLTDGPDVWGVVCLFRDSAGGCFTSGEVRLLRRLVPHLTRGLQAAAQHDWAAQDSPQPRDGDDAGQVGVLLLDAGGRLRLCNAVAVRFAADLSAEASDGHDGARIGGEANQEPSPPDVPRPVSWTVAELRSQMAGHEREARGPAASRSAQHLARGRSGRWYRILASPAEGAEAEDSVIVLLERAKHTAVAPVLARLCGLTPREREVAALVARGQSTKSIARALGISTWTVQEHVSSACARVGVRTRRALVARLFLDDSSLST